MGDVTRRGFVGSLSGAAAAAVFTRRAEGSPMTPPSRQTGTAPIKITDLKCAIIGRNPTVRIVTDQGISGYGQAESAKPYLKPMVLFYKPYLLGEDPTNVASIMLKIRRMGAFKPWGAAVSAIEIALVGRRRARPPDCRFINCLAERSATASVPMETRKTSRLISHLVPLRITPSSRRR